ncbi:hypothetical protein J437_LFUL000044 [Ladona fulva]|uniref:Uncharacterized protein n=1 Tax=Ladona fulva TaxID=123851 RepID=A0A8K0NUG8_LADFU|nr:hypothetical protein J437_LFUL000044 [Ladona fulva]
MAGKGEEERRRETYGGRERKREMVREGGRERVKERERKRDEVAPARLTCVPERERERNGERMRLERRWRESGGRVGVSPRARREGGAIAVGLLVVAAIGGGDRRVFGSRERAIVTEDENPYLRCPLVLPLEAPGKCNARVVAGEEDCREVVELEGWSERRPRARTCVGGVGSGGGGKRISRDAMYPPRWRTNGRGAEAVRRPRRPQMTHTHGRVERGLFFTRTYWVSTHHTSRRTNLAVLAPPCRVLIVAVGGGGNLGRDPFHPPAFIRPPRGRGRDWEVGAGEGRT